MPSCLWMINISFSEGQLLNLVICLFILQLVFLNYLAILVIHLYLGRNCSLCNCLDVFPSLPSPVFCLWIGLIFSSCSGIIVLNWGWFFPPSVFGNFWFPPKGLVPASNGCSISLWMLNPLQYKVQFEGQPPQQRSILPKMSAVPLLRNTLGRMGRKCRHTDHPPKCWLWSTFLLGCWCEESGLPRAECLLSLQDKLPVLLWQQMLLFPISQHYEWEYGPSCSVGSL